MDGHQTDFGIGRHVEILEDDAPRAKRKEKIKKSERERKTHPAAQNTLQVTPISNDTEEAKRL